MREKFNKTNLADWRITCRKLWYISFYQPATTWRIARVVLYFQTPWHHSGRSESGWPTKLPTFFPSDSLTLPSHRARATFPWYIPANIIDAILPTGCRLAVKDFGQWSAASSNTMHFNRHFFIHRFFIEYLLSKLRILQDI